MFTQEESKARTILLTIFGLFLLVDLIFVLYSQEYLHGAVRIVLTFLLMFFVFKGYPWAKWLTIIICSITAIFSFFSAVYFVTINLSIAVFFLFYSFLFLGMVTYLFKNKNLNNYFLKVRGVTSSLKKDN